jgi:hypothetical protein
MAGKKPSLQSLMRRARADRRRRRKAAEAAKPPRAPRPGELRRQLAQRARQREQAWAEAREELDAEASGAAADLEYRVALHQARKELVLQHRLAHVQALVAAVEAQRGTPAVKLTRRGDDLRVYFPRPIGYVTVDWNGRLYGVVRGSQVFAERAMYPGWRRAWRRALAVYQEGLEARMEQFRQEWAELEEGD